MTTRLPTIPRIPDQVQRVPGRVLVVSLVGAGVAHVLHVLVPVVGTLTWALALGVVVANVARRIDGALYVTATKGLLRMGVALLGCSVSVGQILGLGAPVVVLIVGCVAGTLLVTYWACRMARVAHVRALLIAAGCAICGASAVAAVGDSLQADEEDTAAAIATVTVAGSIAMVVMPLAYLASGLGAEGFGVWSGVSVHEVGQVVAAAGQVSAGALGVAVIVKLARVVCLAPVVVALGVVERRSGAVGNRPALVPFFIVVFVVLLVVQSLIPLPDPVLVVVGIVQTASLATGMFGLGMSVNIAVLVRRSPVAIGAGMVGSLVLVVVSLLVVRSLGL